VVVLVALSAAVLLAVGYVLQQHEAAQAGGGRRGPALLLVLVRRPIWLGGIGSMVGGQLLGALALGMGSLVVVEPLLAANVLFALPMGALFSRRWLSRGDWIGAAMLIGGLVVFLLGAATEPVVGGDGPSARAWLLAGSALALVVLVLLTVGRARSLRARAALTATAAGATFGMQDLLTQRAVLRFDDGVVAALTSWQPWVVVVVAVIGLTFTQTAFGTADISASLPPITLAEPVVGIVLSIGLLGQGLPPFPVQLSCAVAGMGLMVAGVVLLTRSPLVVDPHGHRLHRPHRPRRRGAAEAARPPESATEGSRSPAAEGLP
jgi:drug/metabolite transporter (DMT)-like permease